VRSGIGGLLATAALLFVPLLVCARGLRRGAALARHDAMMGLAYCTCVVVSSLGTEVVDLKFAASFYAVMTAVFCGAVLGRRGSEDGPLFTAR
jgi:O-antigen ligase